MVHEILGYKKVNKQYFFLERDEKDEYETKDPEYKSLVSKKRGTNGFKTKNVSNPSLE